MSTYGLVLPEPASISLARSVKIARRPGGPFANNILLRIEPLGASITHGVASSDGNGYRQDLLNIVAATAGNEVRFVGGNPNGTMENNENSGWPGLIIDEVHTKSNNDTAILRPNLVLINVGTNDALRNIDIPNAGARMQSLINDIYTQSPRATVILSSLIRNTNSDAQDRGVQINSQYQALVGSLRGQGKPIIWADMQGSNGPLASDLGPDGTHPLDQGYQKMANIWYSAISQANEADFLKTAENA
ncbi:carbohydrate esterase family 3 protein [Truncatella angustata]|uniref:Carbohydrate esterase family 3 protein n=1 Tax=Truncatella angustata TaxID=152316 RepID=A0A9P8UPD5_9PEZI|nr:carbohydrate esterase family 3 protein [Truncatella angustata]KAH6655760.1 carbohydrate esterase family 3 protein [Truncatella angustata]